MSEIIETRGNHRVRLEPDLSPSEPYNDGGFPLVRFDYRHGWSAEQVTGITSYRLDPRIIEAANSWGPNEGRNDRSGTRATFERFLRIFAGTTTYTEWHSQDYRYVAFDTAHWRDAMGIDDQQIEHDPLVADLDEYRAYVEGDVSGAIVERRELHVTMSHMQRTREQMGGGGAPVTYDEVYHHARQLAEQEDSYTWHEVSSVWGLYGDYARTAAVDYLNEETQ